MAVSLQNQALFGERPNDKRQEAGSQPSERQGRQPAEKILRGKRQGKAKQAKPSRQGKSKQKGSWPLSLFVAFAAASSQEPSSQPADRQQGQEAASKQPSSREAASSRPSDKQAGSKAERQASQQQADKPASAKRMHFHTSRVGVHVLYPCVKGSSLIASQTWTDLPDENQVLNAQKTWTEFGDWNPLSICRKSRSKPAGETPACARIAKSSAIGIADGHESVGTWQSLPPDHCRGNLI